MRHTCQAKELSVAILARDEERHMGNALASVSRLTSEIVVLIDDRTVDHTALIAEGYGARVYVEPWRGFAGQRNRAMELCKSDWILFLDADEQISPELCSEIKEITACSVHLKTVISRSNQESRVAGYWIPRHNKFLGRVVLNGGWYPDYQLRLLRRGLAHYEKTDLVHEVAQLDGEGLFLGGHLWHINVDRFNELWRSEYAALGAQMLYLAGYRANWYDLVIAPLNEFYRRFVRLAGYRDGALGLLLCGTVAYFELVKYMYLKMLEHSTRKQ